ncbi:MAG: hypothetical protein WCT04_04095 [Planctomycetota bacterium]
MSPEKQAMVDFGKGMLSPDKATRLAAITAFEATKPPAPTWPLLVRIATSDPEIDVRHTALNSLAKMPARDGHLAKMLVSIYDALKPNDLKERIYVAKAMVPSEFKADIVANILDQIEKLRWAEEPKGYNGRKVPEKVKEEVKEKQGEFKALLEVFTELSKGDLGEPNKETNIKAKKWWDANQMKFLKADAELLAKYAKEDAEAAKAAKDIAKDPTAKKKEDAPKLAQ